MEKKTIDNKTEIINQKIKYDVKDYDFINIIKNIYKCRELENLHLLISELDTDKRKYFDQIPIIGQDRSNVFIDKFYEHIRYDDTFIEMYKNFVLNYIKKPMYPNENILYQKIPNIRISFPGLSAIGKHLDSIDENIIGIHKDNDFGHCSDEINYILPITNMYDTNSIYYEPYFDSGLDPNKYINLQLDTDYFFQCYFNKLLHYNKRNTTGKTRISFDFRVIPGSKYVDTDKKSITHDIGLKLGEYFAML